MRQARSSAKSRRSRRTAAQASIDCGAWITALTIAVIIRFDFRLNLVDWPRLALITPVALRQF
jgi:hypothetical protein